MSERSTTFLRIAGLASLLTAPARWRDVRASDLLVALTGWLLVASATAGSTPSADLQVEIVDPPAFTEIGATTEVVLRVRNAGPESAASPRVSVGIPHGFEAASVIAPAGWQCALAPYGPITIPLPFRFINCTATDFAREALDFRLRLRVAFPLGFRFSVQVYASATTADPDLSNNLATTRIVSGAPLESDLAVQVEGPRLPVRSGETLRWSVTVSNSGPAAANGFELYWSEVASQVGLIDVPAGWNCLRTLLGSPAFNASIRCTTASMPPASVASFSISRLVSRAQGLRQNFGALFSAMAPADLVESNNLDEANAWIAGGGSASTELAVSARPSDLPGQFVIEVSNSGPSVAEQAWVAFDVPRSSDPVEVAAPGWSCRILQPTFYPPLVDRSQTGCFRAQLPTGVHTLRVTLVPSQVPDSMRVTLTSAANESVLEDNVVDVAFAPTGVNGVPVPTLSPATLAFLALLLASVGVRATTRRG